MWLTLAPGVTVCFSTCGARRIRPCPASYASLPPTGDPRLGSFGPRHGRPGGCAGGIRPLGEIRARTQCGSRFGVYGTNLNVEGRPGARHDCI